jgi:hypothetical protein
VARSAACHAVARFALGPRPAVRIGTDVGGEDLDGDAAVEAGIAGLVDLSPMPPAGDNIFILRKK